jgi:hypothetical protein
VCDKGGTRNIKNENKNAIASSHYDKVENETVERRASATKASVGGRRREINREYCCPYMQLVLLYVAVQNIYPNRTRQNPIHYIYVLTPTAAS